MVIANVASFKSKLRAFLPRIAKLRESAENGRALAIREPRFRSLDSKRVPDRHSRRANSHAGSGDV